MFTGHPKKELFEENFLNFKPWFNPDIESE